MRRRAGGVRASAASWPALVLAALGGVLVAFSLPPWGWWPLAWIGIAVYSVAHSLTGRRRARFACGFLFGLAWLSIGTAWMWQLTAPGYVAASIVFGLYHAAAGLAVPAHRNRWRAVSLPLAHTLVEALRLSFPFGGVPLATLGISQVAGPLAPIAGVGGVIAITWVTLQLATGAAELVRQLTARRTSAGVFSARDGRGPETVAVARPAVMLGIAVVIAVIAPFAPDGRATGDSLTIAAVQGGGEQGTRAIDVPSRIVTDAHLAATATIEPDADLDLVLWPENVVDTSDFPTSWQLAAIVEQAKRLGVPFSVGVTEDVPDQPGRVTNAQVIVTPDGRITSRYDKVRRVPFGEYVPLRGLLEALDAPVDQVPTNAIAGTTPAVLDLPDGHKSGVVISWEVFFGGRAREGVEHGAEFVTNPTNGASYTGTIVQTQQVASSRLRAIETGRWVVQAAPTGFTAIVSPSGEVLQRTSVSERRVLTAEIPMRTGHTWYVDLGDRPFIVLLLIGFAAATIATVRSRRARSDVEHQGDGTVVDDADAHLVSEASGGDHDPSVT